MKDEGQLLIHSANTWSEKTLTNTSPSGKELIRDEIQQLQRSWEGLMSDMTGTKVTLEACLMKWSDYDGSLRQIQKWMKEMERKVRETDSQGDLGEKKASLFRLKVRLGGWDWFGQANLIS